MAALQNATKADEAGLGTYPRSLRDLRKATAFNRLTSALDDRDDVHAEAEDETDEGGEKEQHRGDNEV